MKNTGKQYIYRRRLPHIQNYDSTIFVSFHTAHLTLSSAARDKVFQHCLYEDGKTVEMHAFVVMSNHVHLLLTPLLDESAYPWPLQKIMQRIKSVSAHSINRVMGCSGPVWQEESFDSLVLSDVEFQQKLQYIVDNPVRAGMVQAGEVYRWFWRRA